MTAAADAVHALKRAGLTVATAESLTGGLVCGALTDVPGSSTVVRGAVVSYATDVKADVLGVDGALLASGGAVQAEVARQMAVGVCRVLGADLGVATTGVAGPEVQDGQPVGTVFVALVRPLADVSQVRRLALSGDRAAIRAATVQAVLEMVVASAGEAEGSGARGG